MKNITKFLYLFLLCFCLLVPKASAEKLDLIDKDYDFTKIKSVFINTINLDILHSSQDQHSNNDLLEKILFQDYWDNAKKFAVYNVYNEEQAKCKLSLQTEKDIDQLISQDKTSGEIFFKDNLKLIVDAYVTVSLLNYYTDYYIVPAHTEWRSVTEYDDYYDKDGKKHVRTRTIQVPEFVPDARVNTANVTIRFTLTDAKTGKDVFSREESRCNSYSTNCRECYCQTVRSFFRDLKKKVHKD